MIGSLLLASVMAAPTPRRAAVVIGANEGPEGRARLRYAHRDARRVAEVLVQLGGFRAEDVSLLLEPTAREVLERVGRLRASELAVVYYSGHSDHGALYPSGAPLSIAALGEALRGVSAPARLGVVDACRGGAWTGAKDASAVLPPAPGPVDVWGIAFVASSAGAEDAHESEDLEGSFFTHHWIAGLRGAADANGDRLTTLDESLAYARPHTIRDSAQRAGRAQHPSFQVDLRGEHGLVLTDLRDASSVLEVQWDRGQLIVFELRTGRQVAKLHWTPQGARIVLPTARYLLRHRSDDGVRVADVDLSSGLATIGPGDFTSAPSTRVDPKGLQFAGTDVLAPRGGQLVVGGQAWFPAETPIRLSYHVNWPIGRSTGSYAAFVQLGLSDRWSLSLGHPVGVQVRLGAREGRFEATALAGYLVQRVGFRTETRVVDDDPYFSNPREVTSTTTVLRVSPALQAALRVGRGRWLGRASVEVYASVPGPHDDERIGDRRPYGQLATGLSFRLHRRATVNLGVAGLIGPSSEPVNGVALGSVLGHGPRLFPLLRIHVVRSLGLDGYAHAVWSGGRAVDVGAGFGVTWAPFIPGLR